MRKLVWTAAIAALGCGSAQIADDAGAHALDGGAHDAGSPERDAGPPDAGPRDAGPPDGGSAPCMTRCTARALECSAPADIASAECAAICGAAPTEEQLACVEALSCEAAACTYPAHFPCAIGVTDSVPISQCMTVCVATAERCGAPADVASTRCAATCPLVTDGKQLACLQGATCEELTCIENAGHLPCGVGAGAPLP